MLNLIQDEIARLESELAELEEGVKVASENNDLHSYRTVSQERDTCYDDLQKARADEDAYILMFCA